MFSCDEGCIVTTQPRTLLVLDLYPRAPGVLFIKHERRDCVNGRIQGYPKMRKVLVGEGRDSVGAGTLLPPGKEQALRTERMQLGQASLVKTRHRGYHGRSMSEKLTSCGLEIMQ